MTALERLHMATQVLVQVEGPDATIKVSSLVEIINKALEQEK